MPEPRTGEELILLGGRVVMPDRLLENATNTIGDGRIQRVSISEHFKTFSEVSDVAALPILKKTGSSAVHDTRSGD